MVALRLGNASGRGKECVRSFCKRAPEQVRLKSAVELLPLWQLGILVNVTEIIYSWEAVPPPPIPPPGLRTPWPLFSSLQDLFCPRPLSGLLFRMTVLFFVFLSHHRHRYQPRNPTFLAMQFRNGLVKISAGISTCLPTLLMPC